MQCVSAVMLIHLPSLDVPFSCPRAFIVTTESENFTPNLFKLLIRYITGRIRTIMFILLVLNVFWCFGAVIGCLSSMDVYHPFAIDICWLLLSTFEYSKYSKIMLCTDPVWVFCLEFLKYICSSMIEHLFGSHYFLFGFLLLIIHSMVTLTMWLFSWRSNTFGNIFRDLRNRIHFLHEFLSENWYLYLYHWMNIEHMKELTIHSSFEWFSTKWFANKVVGISNFDTIDLISTKFRFTSFTCFSEDANRAKQKTVYLKLSLRNHRYSLVNLVVGEFNRIYSTRHSMLNVKSGIGFQINEQ